MENPLPRPSAALSAPRRAASRVDIVNRRRYSNAMVTHRVLFVADPRHHHAAEGHAILRDALLAARIEVILTESPAAVSQLASGGFDCVMLYTQDDTFDPQQVEALTKFV